MGLLPFLLTELGNVLLKLSHVTREASVWIIGETDFHESHRPKPGRSSGVLDRFKETRFGLVGVSERLKRRGDVVLDLKIAGTMSVTDRNGKLRPRIIDSFSLLLNREINHTKMMLDRFDGFFVGLRLRTTTAEQLLSFGLKARLWVSFRREIARGDSFYFLLLCRAACKEIVELSLFSAKRSRFTGVLIDSDFIVHRLSFRFCSRPVVK
jgi:hypothetical protein